MDVAYDRVQDDALSPVEQEQQQNQQQQDGGEGTESQRERSRSVNLQDELRDTYKALSESTWGAKLGGFFNTVKQQGGSYYERAGEGLSSARVGASKGITDLLSQTRSLSLAQLNADVAASRTNTSTLDPTISLPDTVPEATATATAEGSKDVPTQQPESLPADIYREAQSMFSSFRSSAAATASTRIEQIQRAEDAADEALLKFGANLRNLLRDAVTITAPTDADQLENDPRVKRSLLFESKDADGRRVVHATRFDAQLHVIHTTETSFTADPTDTPEFDSWKGTFDVEKKTDEIAAGLEKYPELRRAMERLVPEKVDYANFWRRYYFLKHAIETEERKRRELLKGTALNDEEEVNWDDDEDEDEEVVGRASTPTKRSLAPQASTEAAPRPSTDTITGSNSSNDLLKPNEPRRSNEHSVADSDASYDIVSGAPSRGPDSPKESEKKKLGAKPVAEESDEEDWE